MRIGIVGREQSGRKTLFRLFTGSEAAPSHGRLDFPVGASPVPDARVDRLAELLRSKKRRFAEIEWVLFPSLPEDRKAREKWLDEARLVDGLCLVVRDFADPGVYHPEGSVDARRDLAALDVEFVIADLASVEGSIERTLEEKAKRTAADREARRRVLEKLKAELDAERPLRGIELTPAEEERLSGQRFLTRLPGLVLVNVDESAAGDKEAHEKALAGLGLGRRPGLCLSLKVEAELAEIEDEAERGELMAGLGVTRDARAVLSRAALDALGHITFLTAGEKESRAWLLRRGASVVEAAGVIHTDFERGFIRAESASYEDFMAAGSEQRLKELGKMHTRGRDYVVQEGDWLHVLATT